jgi:hypothetical protein
MLALLIFASIWVVCAAVIILMIARTHGKLTVAAVLSSLFFGPVWFVLSFLDFWISESDKVVLWEKKK